jgi:hypothetical protein
MICSPGAHPGCGHVAAALHEKQAVIPAARAHNERRWKSQGPPHLRRFHPLLICTKSFIINRLNQGETLHSADKAGIGSFQRGHAGW